ncbi:MAG: phosphatidate cytidylyltransferase, partial [Oscillospiraceae bacterium]|nr:phosphatidate cytidylyltransferase [Oscillospiraceae bacterium]
FVIFNLVYVSFFAKGCGVNYFISFFLGMICAALGTLGDLTASLIKRQCGIKDYGKIMPGHGGFMDRFDSVLFVAPFMYAYLSVMDMYV